MYLQTEYIFIMFLSYNNLF